MSNVALLQRLGLFIQKDFLSSEICLSVLAGVRAADTEPVMVLSKSDQILVAPRVDELQRITQQMIPPAFADCVIRKQLSALRPVLEQHFDLTFSGYQDPLFYRYNPGGFFAAHQDCTDTPDAPAYLRDRRVSIIIFLNSPIFLSSPAQEPLERMEGTYCGGALTFYGLMNDPRYGFPLTSEPGMLVAFRSHISHEVQRVTAGERYSIVSWFY